MVPFFLLLFFLFFFGHMQDLHHKKGELWPQEALRLVGNEGPNGLLGNWAAGKQVIAVKWFWLTNQMACLPGWKN